MMVVRYDGEDRQRVTTGILREYGSGSSVSPRYVANAAVASPPQLVTARTPRGRSEGTTVRQQYWFLLTALRSRMYDPKTPLARFTVLKML